MNQVQHLRNEPQLRFKSFSYNYNFTNIGKSTSGVISGRTPNRLDSSIWGGSIPWITSGDIHQKFITHGQLFLNENAINNLSLHLIPINSVLMGTAGQGKTRCTVGVNTRELCTNDAMLSMIPNDDVYYLYLLYLLEGKYQRLRLLTPQETKTRLTTNNLKSFKINLPGLKEQKQVANFVFSVEKKISMLELKLNNLKLFKKGLYKYIFYNLKSSYIKQLMEICELKKGMQLNKIHMNKHGVYYVLNGGRSPSGMTSNYNTYKNTISISEGGNSCGFVTYNQENFWSGGHLYTIENLSRKVDKIYLYHYLKYKEQRIMNLRVGSGLPNIQKSVLSQFEVKLVEIDKQLTIASNFNFIENRIKLTEEQLFNLMQFKKGLLQQMFV